MQITIRKRVATEDEEDQRARKLQQLMAEPELDIIAEEVPEQSLQDPVARGSVPAFSSDDEDGDGARKAQPARAVSPSPSFSDLSD